MELVIAGGGAGGLLSGLLLAEDGHRVTILERDPEGPPDPSEVWDGWSRPGVTQFHQPHNLLTRFWTICDRDLPDLSEALLALGGALTRSVDMRSPAILDEPTTHADEQIKMVGIRRPILEQSIARYADDHPGISVVRGAAVTGLLTVSEHADGAPHIVGVAADDGHEYRADLVIDAAGRRSPFARFAKRLGVKVSEMSESDGFTYFSRWFKLPDGLPKLTSPPIAGIAPGLLALLFPADDNYAGLAMVGPASNRDLRQLKNPERFMAMTSAMPTAADWFSPKRAQPVSDILTMGSIPNRQTRFWSDGHPTMTGVVNVGDAFMSTNPSLGRGISLALVFAEELRELLSLDPGPVDLATSFDEAKQARLTPWLDDAIDSDRRMLAIFEAALGGDPPGPPNDLGAIRTAAAVDMDLWRIATNVSALELLPDEATAIPGVVERARQLLPTVSFPGLDLSKQQLDEILLD